MATGRKQDLRRETVNHPAHYNAGKIEVIDAIEDWCLGFDLGNAVKYIARAGRKGAAIADLQKAEWYVRRAIQRLRYPGLTSRQAQERERTR
jgi:hypothetical protein